MYTVLNLCYSLVSSADKSVASVLVLLFTLSYFVHKMKSYDLMNALKEFVDMVRPYVLYILSEDLSFPEVRINALLSLLLSKRNVEYLRIF